MTRLTSERLTFANTGHYVRAGWRAVKDPRYFVHLALLLTINEDNRPIVKGSY